MKRILLTLLFLSLSLFAKPLNEVHKVAVLKNWKPYYSLDKRAKPTGYAIELFEKIASNIGLKYEYVIVDGWKEAMKLIEEGSVDIIPNTGITPARSKFMNFTQQTDVFEVGLFKNSRFKDLKNVKNLGSKTVGVVLKNVCERLTIKNKIYFKNYHSALASLENNEIDTLCYPKPLLNYSIMVYKTKRYSN